MNPEQTERDADRAEGCEGGLRLRNAHRLSERACPLVSIITVVYNGADYLEQTIRSVRERSGGLAEFIVIDGASQDDSLSIIRANEEHIDYWRSEPDRGIYDAMNKGIACSTGTYLLFLNARDELVIDLREIEAELRQGCALVCGKANMLGVDGQLHFVKGKRLKSLDKLVRGTPLCHQAIFFRRDVMGTYDSSFRVIGDRVKTFEIVRDHGLQCTLFVDLPVVNYYEGGFSRQNQLVWQREEYLFLRAVGRWFYAEYKRFGWWYKLRIKQPLTRLIRH